MGFGGKPENNCKKHLFSSGVFRFQIWASGHPQQQCPHPVLWRAGQALAGSWLEDGLDPYPWPKRYFWQWGENIYIYIYIYIYIVNIYLFVYLLLAYFISLWWYRCEIFLSWPCSSVCLERHWIKIVLVISLQNSVFLCWWGSSIYLQFYYQKKKQQAVMIPNTICGLTRCQCFMYFISM